MPSSVNLSAPAEYDLHLHTWWSYDATADPQDYFRRAVELGVRCLAITEHHNVDSAEDVALIAEQYPQIRWIRAAELSVTTSIGSVDLLCYNLPAKPVGALAACLEEYHAWQRAKGGARARGLQALGYDYGEADRLEMLRAFRPARVVERQGATHALSTREADYFHRRGWIASREEFGSLVGRISPEFRGPCYPKVETVVPAVKEAGGLVVIAHPAGYFLQNDLLRMDLLREECALDGIECAHRAVDPALTSFYRDYCLRHGLLSTAGSDSHHPEDLQPPAGGWGYTPARHFASHIGDPCWLDELLERLA